MEKNHKIITGVVAFVLIIGVVALASDTALFKGQLVVKPDRDCYIVPSKIYRSNGQYVSDVTSEVSSQVTTNVTSAVPSEVASTVVSEVTSDVTSIVVSEVTTEITTEVPSEVISQVSSSVPSQVISEVTSDNTSQVTSDVPSEVASEVAVDKGYIEKCGIVTVDRVLRDKYLRKTTKPVKPGTDPKERYIKKSDQVRRSGSEIRTR